MLVCIISDIHGNLPALELVLKKTKHVDLHICLGDVVNYGPWSNECVDLLDSVSNKILLLGNHEENFINGKYPEDNIIVKQFHDFCYARFNRTDVIKKYLTSYKLNNFFLSHTLNNIIIFEDTKVYLGNNTIIGHSHKQFLTKKNNHLLVNPGSVGQNRTLINIINYIIWNTQTNKFFLLAEKHNIDYTINEMKELKYPPECISYYSNKNRA
jgi:putative phosphoesterase